jgi:hypothetical protein
MLDVLTSKRIPDKSFKTLVSDPFSLCDEAAYIFEQLLAFSAIRLVYLTRMDY